MDTTWTAKLVADLRGWPLARVIFVVYAILILPIYCLPVCTPDEIWFERDARMFADAWREMSPWQVLTSQQNHLGYGAAYWLFYGLMACVTSHPLVLMRGLALAANLTIPSLLLWRCRDASQEPNSHQSHQSAAICAMLVWISFTGAWWTGKVTGPELISMALVFAGLHFLSNARSSRIVLAAGVLVGFGVGIKSNAAPAALCILFILPQVPRPWQSLGIVMGSALVGLLLANPFAIGDPTAFLANIRRHDKFGAGYTTNHLAEVMWNTNWEWEGVFRGGYFNWGMFPLAFPIYLGFLWKGKLPWTWFAGGLSCTVIGFLIYLTSRTYQGWYWLPLLSLFPLTVMHLRQVDRATWRWAIAFVVVNLIGNSPWIGMQYFSKLEQYAHTFERRKVLAEAEKFAATPRDGMLVMILDQGIELAADKTPFEVERKQVVSDLSGYFLLNELRFGAREMKPGETWFVIHDLRLRKYNPIVEPIRDAQRLGPEYEIEEREGEYVTSLRIHRRALTAKRPGATR